ncbi:MAG TPA: hypothetical protein VEY51_02495 [Chondromyces sp.]|nr:hypothetical protein [Chondromyces sp.]
MIDYDQFPKRSILCVDIKSFYSSVAAVRMGLDPMTCYLAVVGDTARPGSVVLAASPRMKKEFGIKTGSRLFEIPRDPRIRVVNPQMELFIKVSTDITRLFYRYVPPSAVHTYSIDESFLDVKGLERQWGDPRTIAKRIQSHIKKDFGLICTVGIGPNMLMSKLCLDLEAKDAPGGIAEWTYEDVPKKLWPVRPLSKMWGIGSRMEHALNRMRIFNVGQLARYDLKRLEKKFGIMGNQIYYHAWGIDLSEVGAPIMEKQSSFGKSQILLRDYKDKEEVKHVILEICEEVARRARNARKAGRTITLGIGYSREEFGGGFSRARTVEKPTNITMDLYHVCLDLFHENHTGRSVRQISVSISNLVDDEEMQLDLFDEDGWKRRKLGYVVDEIRDKYGPTAILRAVSYTPGGTALQRAKLVGGHKA